MARLSITIASWDYDRVRAVMDGRVPVEGCEVNYLALSPEECFHRAFHGKEFEVSEIGFSPHIVAQPKGGTGYIGIPVFLSRIFRHSAIYVRKDRGIRAPADLRGKRVGVPTYQMTAALWARGMIKDDFGVGYTEMNWFQGGLEQPGRKEFFENSLPAGFPLSPIPEGKTISGMLAAGELDAAFSARAPSCHTAGHPQIGRLFEDFATVERDYFKRTGIFPIMHALGIRKDVHERHPWLASSLYKAFIAAKRLAEAEFEEVTALKITLPWIASEARATRALMGENFWPYGVAENRKTLETMVRYVHEQGLSARPVKVEELFASATLETPKI